MKNLFGLFFITVYLLTCSPGTAGSVVSLTPEEFKLRAAYLYNFSKFIRWPETAFAHKTAPFVIGVVGGEGILKSLSLLTSRKVGSHPIKIRPYPPENTIEKLYLLYVQGNVASVNLAGWKVKDKSIITVGDDPNFIDQGGMIQFVTIRNRLRFIINVKAIKAVGVRMDSRLLSLAIELRE